MITGVYLEPSRRVMMGFFAKIVKAVNYYCKKSSIVDVPLRHIIRLLSNDTIIMTFHNIENAARMTLYFASGKLLFLKIFTLIQSYIFPVRMDNWIVME